MDDKTLKNILNEIEDFQAGSTRCNDLQQIVNYCRENYDFWKDIKLSFVFSSYHNSSISFDINDFVLDNRNRVLEFISNQEKDTNFTILDLEKLINYLKSDDSEWGNYLITCEEYFNPISCYVDEDQKKICLVSS